MPSAVRNGNSTCYRGYLNGADGGCEPQVSDNLTGGQLNGARGHQPVCADASWWPDPTPHSLYRCGRMNPVCAGGVAASGNFSCGLAGSSFLMILKATRLVNFPSHNFPCFFFSNIRNAYWRQMGLYSMSILIQLRFHQRSSEKLSR